VCSTSLVAESAADREWVKGYEAARTMCLTASPDAARHHDRSATSEPWRAGFDWGLWDYEDANGLPHEGVRRA